MKNKINKKNKKLRIQLIFAIILMTLVVFMTGYQVYLYAASQDQAEDIKYTAVVFGTPMKQSIEVIMLSATNENESVIDNSSSKIEYSDIKNYKEENLQRYQDYHLKYPELLDAEVIWRVNTDLDLDFYTYIKEIEDPYETTLVVNKYNKFEKDFEPEDLVLMESEKEKLYLRDEANQAYLELREEVIKRDLNIKVSEAYRSYRNQEILYKEKLEELGSEVVDSTVERPGHSEHQSGLAICVSDGSSQNGSFDKSDLHHFIVNNAHRYGFIIRYKGDPSLTGLNQRPWHLRYVGKEVAVDMYEKNINILEEYLDKRGLQILEVEDNEGWYKRCIRRNNW